MKRSRTGSAAGKAPALASVATVQVPLPLLAVLADAQTAFFGLCLTAGQQVFQTLMEQDRTQLRGPKNVPDPARPTPFIIDGGTGLRKAIRETSGALGLVQRCQVHYADQRIMPSATRG